MEKICIVRRRRIGWSDGATPQLGVDSRVPSEPLTIELTPQQMERVRANNRIQDIYGTTHAPIILSLHLNASFPTKMLKSEQICDMLQISKSTLARLVKAGTFRSHKVGRLRRFTAEDVMEYLSNGVEIRSLRSVPGTNTLARSAVK